MVKKRAYLYCRTAHPDKDALEAQKRNLTAYAEAQDFTITGVVSESGSGLDYSRAGLHEAMWAVAEKDVDVLLIANLSRLGRDTYKMRLCCAGQKSVVSAQSVRMELCLRLFQKFLTAWYIPTASPVRKIVS